MANWASLKNMLERYYGRLLRFDEKGKQDFANFRLRTSDRTTPFDPCLTYFENVVVMSIDVGDDEAILERSFPNLFINIQQSLEKTRMEKKRNGDLLIIVFFDEEEKDFAEEVSKKYFGG